MEGSFETAFPLSLIHILTAYNNVNGKYTSEDRELTEDILRDEWGFKGLVMSDWNAGKDAVTSIVAGNDMLQPCLLYTSSRGQ